MHRTLYLQFMTETAKRAMFIQPTTIFQRQLQASARYSCTDIKDFWIISLAKFRVSCAQSYPQKMWITSSIAQSKGLSLTQDSMLARPTWKSKDRFPQKSHACEERHIWIIAIGNMPCRQDSCISEFRLLQRSLFLAGTVYAQLLNLASDCIAANS